MVAPERAAGVPTRTYRYLPPMGPIQMAQGWQKISKSACRCSPPIRSVPVPATKNNPNTPRKWGEKSSRTGSPVRQGGNVQRTPADVLLTVGVYDLGFGVLLAVQTPVQSSAGIVSPRRAPSPASRTPYGYRVQGRVTGKKRSLCRFRLCCSRSPDASTVPLTGSRR